MKDDVLEVRESPDQVVARVDGMQESVNRAFAPLAEAAERHECTLQDNEAHIGSMDARFEAQAAALEQLVSAQSTMDEMVQETRRREMAISSDAPPPPLPRASGGRDRIVEPHVLQADASAMFNVATLVESLGLWAEAANLTPDDIDTQVPTGTPVSKRWTLVVKGRDSRTTARRAPVLLGAQRDGSGWRKVEMESAAGERVPLYIAPDKKPRAP